MSIHKKILEKHGINQTEPSLVSQPESLQTQQLKLQEVSQTYQGNQELTKLQSKIEEYAPYNSSQHIYLTSKVFPKSRSVNLDTKIPLGVSINPYGDSVYNGFPSTSYTQTIFRCDSCRAYVNPFMEFTRDGTDMRCNLCNWVSQVPHFFFKPLDPKTGKRQDFSDLPELHYGSFDIKAGQDYQARPPMPPTFFFIVDVSQANQRDGIFGIFADTLRTIIEGNLIQGDERVMIGLMTFDSTIQLYDFRSGRKQAQIINITDLSELELPVPGDLLVNLADTKNLFLDLLSNLVGTYKENKVQYATCFSSALEFAKQIMKQIGGKIIVITSSASLSSQDPYFSTKTEDSKRNFMLPSNSKLSQLSSDLHLSFICPSIFIFSEPNKFNVENIENNFLTQNTITYQELAKYLNGDIFYYMSDELTQRKFYYDFLQVVTKDYTWESVFRIRLSSGFKIKNTYGNYSVKSNDLLNLTCQDDQKYITYELDFTDGVCRSDTLYMQSALLYTTNRGERRIRVHNYAIPLTYDAKSIYNFADSNQITNIIMKQVLVKFYKDPDLNTIRTHIIERAKEILRPIYQQTKNLPESLATLPLNILAILKNQLFSHSFTKSSLTDYLNSLRIPLNYSGPYLILNYLVPMLFRIEDIVEYEGICDSESEYGFQYPPLHQLALSTISEKCGMFLMDLGTEMIFYITKAHDEKLATQIFGQNYLDIELNEDTLFYLPEAPINIKLQNLINELRNQKTSKYCPIYIIKQGDFKSQREHIFLQNLLLDDLFPKYRFTYDKFYKYLVE